MNEISQDVILKCQQGSAEAFAEILDVYERPIYSYVYKVLYNSTWRNETEDIVQDIFIKAYSNICSVRTGSEVSFSCWLFAIARNHCLSLLRKKTIVIDDLYSEDMKERGVEKAGAGSPRDVMLKRELWDEVAGAIGRLPEEQRSALLLRYYEDLSYEEISSVMGCSIGTVRSRLARARGKLQEELKNYMNFAV